MFQVRTIRRKSNTRKYTAAGRMSESSWLERWFPGKDWQRVRIGTVVILFALAWAGLWGRAAYLQIFEGAKLSSMAQRQHMTTEMVAGHRGNIFDRNGQMLARSVKCLSVGVRPRDIVDCEQSARTLAAILRRPENEILGRLTHGNRFFWLARKIDDAQAEAIRKAGLPGINLTQEYDRVYPTRQMAGQLLGFVGIDDRGLEGLERALDGYLSGTPVKQQVLRDARGRRFYLKTEGQPDPGGKDVHLTLDMQVQFFAEEALSQAVNSFQAKWGGALVVDVPSGEILAWAQYPFFNPNSYREYTPAQYRNRLASDALEPGSTFKPFVVAAALEERKVSPDTAVNCEGGKWETRNITIRDTAPRGVLPVSRVIRYSSNIGMAKIGVMLGSKTLHGYLDQLGFGSRTGLPLAESRGILRPARRWREADLMCTAFGQSISVTMVQMAQAYLTLLNGGVYKPLRLVLNEDLAPVASPTRIFSERTCRQVMRMMQDVVESEDGTGKAARIPGLSVGGKTGTAQKARGGVYGQERTASFAGFVPADKPRYLIIVFVDSPARSQYGGIVSAPVFQKIATSTLTYRGNLPDSLLADADKKREEARAAAAKLSRRQRGVKASDMSGPLFSLEGAAEIAAVAAAGGERKGLTRAAALVPDVVGKSVRNAVELFVRGGMVPVLKGDGQRVVRQKPAPGAAWPHDPGPEECILWLSEK